MKLQAKSRLLAFAPTSELTDVIRTRVAEALHKVGLKVQPQHSAGIYPTILYFDFESSSWAISIGEVQHGVAQLFVETPREITNEALRLFTRTKSWDGVEAANELVRRCLAILKKTGIHFELEQPNVIHKLVTIAGTFPVPKQLKAAKQQLAYHFTEGKNVRKIEREGLKLTKEGQGLWKGSLKYGKPSIFLTMSKKPEVVSQVMGMLLSKRWSLEEWGEFDESKLRAVNAQYRAVTIDLAKVPGAVLYQDELVDEPEFKFITVPVPPEAIVSFFMVEPNWWNA